jgi:tetratricopeptide (TPR) repeat protein
MVKKNCGNERGKAAGQLARARRLGRAGRIEAALALCQSVQEQEPERLEAWVVASDLLFSAQRYEEALKAIERAIALAPPDAFLLANCGTLQALLGRHEQSIASFDLAVELAPQSSPLLWMNYAASMAALARAEEALCLYERGLQLGPPPGQAAVLLAGKGEALLALNRPADALSAFSEAARLLPRPPSGSDPPDDYPGEDFFTYLAGATAAAGACALH